MRIKESDVAALQRGVSLLGSGGGGDTAIAAALLCRQLSGGRTILLRRLAELPPQDRVVPVGIAGGPPVLHEKLPGGHEFAAAIAAIQRWTGETTQALMSIEIGGFNGLLPFAAAVDLELPVMDADLSGRGLARFDQFAAAIGGTLPPIAFAEPGGQVVVHAGGRATDVERTVRAFLACMGGWAVAALAPIRAAELAGASIAGTVSGALELGRNMAALGENPALGDLEAAIGGEVLAEGRVVDVFHHLGHGGFGRGWATVTDRADGALLRLEMENEYLVALRDGEVVASTPDVLAVVDRRTCASVGCDAVRRGAEVAVLRLPAAPFWTEPGHIELLAPRSYGIDSDPVVGAR